MKVLVLNSGSSSVKYELRDSETGQVLAAADVSRIGEEDGITDHGRALELVLEALVAPDSGPLRELSEVDAVGHRVVHGGSHFSGPALVDADVIAKIEECAPLAPLHNPPALLGIRAALRVLPHTPQVAVFDTAFHSTIPPQAHVYALPYAYYERDHVRRYGFHGISLQSVTRSVDAMLGGRLRELKVIVAHLGNGASITAVDRGASVDTSMGLTPLEGLVMGTRAGDLDPGVLLFLMRQAGLSPEDLDRVLNKESGLLGVSGVSNDMRDVLRAATDVLEAASAGEAPSATGAETAGGGVEGRRARLALDAYCYRVKKYIGAYAAAMGGLDALVFTAGVGENSPEIRERICAGLGFLGVEVDAEANAKARGVRFDIAAAGSRVNVLVVPTDEEQVIADETVAVILSGQARPAE
jgi:acetate kinase